ncbi:metallophosphoesterase [Micromonospora endophytica]|nr:metallophosphoesterase [Micromonospora endophytica]
MIEGMPGSLFATSDLHVAYPENRQIVDRITPESADDWLIVAGDVGERFGDIERTLRLLRDRFARVIWAPGNHELWTHANDPVRLRGEHRYRELVRMCRGIDVLTPEDDYAVWAGEGGPVTVAPLFLLYDYTFRPAGAATKEEALRQAYDKGVVCTDEMVLHPDPYPDRESWCHARVAESERRLAATDPALPTLLINHWPLVRQPTEVLWYPEFAQWCGTVRTADWHLRFRAAAVVYGHLHIPRTTHYDGIRFEEVSLGYPREWSRRDAAPNPLRRIFGPRP